MDGCGEWIAVVCSGAVERAKANMALSSCGPLLGVGEGDGEIFGGALGAPTLENRESMAALERWGVGCEDGQGPGEGVMLANNFSTSDSSPPDDGASERLSFSLSD